MQEWYLMTPETRPNITGGFENDAFLDYKEDAFGKMYWHKFRRQHASTCM